MARKKNEYYFDTFVELVDYSCQAANLLKDIMNNLMRRSFVKNGRNVYHRTCRGSGGM